MSNDSHLDITLEATPKNAVNIRHAVEKYLVSVGLNDEQIFSLKLAVGEAVSNVVEHAYGNEQHGMVTISGFIYDDKLQISIEDFGTWRDITEVKEERGRGFLLMGALTDNYAVAHKSGNGTLVTLVTKLLKIRERDMVSV